MTKMTNSRWDMGSRDHEYVESITMYKGEDSGEDSEDDLDYDKEEAELKLKVCICRKRQICGTLSFCNNGQQKVA